MTPIISKRRTIVFRFIPEIFTAGYLRITNRPKLLRNKTVQPMTYSGPAANAARP